MFHSSPFASCRLYTSLFCCVSVSMLGWNAKAATLSDNLGQSTSYTEVISGSTWITASFGTGNAGSTLINATLLLQSNSGGVLGLDLYSTQNGRPGTLLGSLTPPTSFRADLSQTVFGGAGLLLAANTEYWLVAKATTGGDFEWAYTASNRGSGIGFRGTWGYSEDAGATWFTSGLEPMQMRVDDSSSSVVPEPGSLGLLSLAALAGTLAQFQTRRRSDQ